jgi:hypothetical protein
MSEIKGYKTAREETGSELDEKVNRLIREGWQPFGSPYVSSKANDHQLCQALTHSQLTVTPSTKN